MHLKNNQSLHRGENSSSIDSANYDLVKEGLDFIINHFDPTVLYFPRTVMTKKLGYQKEVFAKEEAMILFEESNFIDCRINAYCSFTGYNGNPRFPPDFIFIDLDKTNFKTERSLKIALSRILKNIQEKLDGHPTVLWTGNGYHIYQPIYAFVLEDIELLKEFDEPSKKFLRFAKDYLSMNKADKSNYPSFKSCLIRIPFSYNSKCLSRGESIENSQVKIIQKWDGKRPSINNLLRYFRRYLKDEKIKENIVEQKKRRQNNHNKFNNNDNKRRKEYKWIEKLLQIPLNDGRENITHYVLAPYLINVKRLPYDESRNIINDWLSKCNVLSRLDKNYNYIVKRYLDEAVDKKIPSMGLEKLKEKHKDIYSEIIKKL